MIRHLFIALIVIHGLIHLVGAIKGFQWAEIAALSAPVSKVRGLIWLISSILLVGTAILCGIRSQQWIWLGLAALILSQLLITAYWQDARFGTVPNLILALVIVGGFLNRNFSLESERQVQRLEQVASETAPTYHRVDDLPEALQRWLKNACGDKLHPPMRGELKQKLKLKLRREQEDWYQGRADQFFHFGTSSFIWLLNLDFPGGIEAHGRDRLGEGAGHMEVRLGGAIPVVNAHGGTALTEGSLQRYLGELVWFPPAMLDARIDWKELDENSAHARLEAHGQVAEGIFTFDEEGRFQSFSTERYYGGEKDATKHLWVVEVMDYGTLNGWKLPLHCKATWAFDDGEWTWAEIEVVDLEVFHSD